jgi:hypothetical protein
MTSRRQQIKLDLDAIFSALEGPLALVDDPERRAAFQRYVEAARLHLERAIFDLLSGAIETVNEAGADVTARLQYQAGALHLVVEPRAQEADNEQDSLFTIGDEVDKVTIRLPAELKELISQAASLRGMSINSWYVRELARAVREISRQLHQEERQQERGRKGPHGRLRGFIRSE